LSAAGAEPQTSPSWRVSAREDPLARAVFALLVLGSFAAFGVTQSLKHTPTIVQGIEMNASFRPGSPAHALERISFKIRHADRVRVTVIDSQGDTVRTLAHRLAMPAYKRVWLYWNGHEAHARRAPPGTYRVRIALLNQKRELLTPGAFELLPAEGGR
jgi:hypothetical protein